jgi:hypothetical protein
VRKKLTRALNGDKIPAEHRLNGEGHIEVRPAAQVRGWARAQYPGYTGDQAIVHEDAGATATASDAVTAHTRYGNLDRANAAIAKLMDDNERLTRELQACKQKVAKLEKRQQEGQHYGRKARGIPKK